MDTCRSIPPSFAVIFSCVSFFLSKVCVPHGLARTPRYIPEHVVSCMKACLKVFETNVCVCVWGMYVSRFHPGPRFTLGRGENYTQWSHTNIHSENAVYSCSLQWTGNTEWVLYVFSAHTHTHTHTQAERDVPLLTPGKPDKPPWAKPGLIDRSVTPGREVDSCISTDIETPRLQENVIQKNVKMPQTVLLFWELTKGMLAEQLADQSFFFIPVVLL